MAEKNLKTMLAELIDDVGREGASDLHLAEGRRPSIRVSGTLIPLIRREVLAKAEAEALLSLILRPGDKEIFTKEKQVDFSWSSPEGARFRGNAFFQQGAISIALRMIPKSIRTLTELNLPPVLKSFTDRQQGFFLVVGPIGHGKSTTLASLIEIINSSRPEHIVTIEDPIEYVYEAKQSIVDQREVRIDTPDFQSALDSIFRQDADVVLIGEMRELRTIATAVTAAETGHLVFSTLHTNSASQTIERILDIFPSNQQDQIRVQLAGSLTCIFSQRLVPRVSGGLIPAFELLINNNAVANLIRERRT